ncbi:MAG: chromosome segregation protein SMC [Spirochaetes bacterium GWB1_48_6]|nr:MAG: chromosome segregation protein SMC [Spirochaetes bacterium GWB1_48_6]
MFLKSIEIFGFKSFADRARIEFSDGITALLGPNGCGKSNVVDSIKWVLGEQATKSLRADKMEDIIFNGTEHRKALNVAEVSLTLANDEGILDLDMPEVEVKRRLYRSGESEYYINGAQVKLKEVRELFFDTGVGKVSYSIMEQGKIDQILSNKPEERRYIFEEAAGITKFKIRGQEAERKLEKTEENLRQVEGILGEVKRSYDTLKSQADKTKRFRLLKKEIFDIEKTLNLLRLTGFKQQKEQILENLEKQTTDRNRLKEEIDKLNDSMESYLDEMNEMETKLIDIQKKLYGIDLEKTGLENQTRLVKDREGQLQSQIAAARARLVTLQDKILSLALEKKEKIQSLENIKKEIEEIQKNITSFTENIAGAQERIAHNDEVIQSSQVKISELETLDQSLQGDLREVTDRLVQELDRKLKEAGVGFEDLLGLEKGIERGLETLGIYFQGRRDFLGDLVKTGKIPGNDPMGLVKSFLEALELPGKTTLETLEFFKKYKALAPTFLNDFLAPQGILTQKRELEERLQTGQKEMMEKRDLVRNLGEENAGLRIKIEDYRQTLEDLKLTQMKMLTQQEGLDESLKRLTLQQGEEELRLREVQQDEDDNKKRLIDIELQLDALEEKKDKIQKEEKLFKGDQEDLEKKIIQKNQNLQGQEKDLKFRVDALNGIQNKVESLQMETAQVSTEIKNLFDNFRDKHSVDLVDFQDELPPETPTKDLRDLLNQKKDEHRSLGQVNLMAVEEFTEVEERYNFLSGQLEDLRKAREDLRTVTREIQKESSHLLAEAFAIIQKNFNQTFRRLFGGGRAELRLTDPDNILESGIEMLCQPPGKKLESISLLSGGERSLTAVGLLFATYQVKPSPFCILDEIDAALDEANVGRFVNMLMEFGQTSQFIVITHNKKTVAGAGTMIGVTMEESGVSKVIAIRLQNNAEARG